MRVFWWNVQPNIGDTFTSLWLDHAGIDVEWAPPETAELVGAGSVLELFADREVTVFGTGRAGHRAGFTRHPGRVKAVRGLFTRELIYADVDVLGDPGLLASDLTERTDGGYTAIVPHWEDQGRMRASYPDAEFVDVMGDPMTELAKLAGAERVISSSLHGIVFADAFGIERYWDYFPGVQAYGFKFRDYASVIGKFNPSEWKTANTARVRAVQGELRECLTV